MEIWLCAVILALACVIFFLIGKIYFLRRAAREIRREFADRLRTETNTLIDISGRDREMRQLAADINRELRTLRALRHSYQQGDRELKEAVTNISHDLRTPLTAICGYLELLKEEDQTEQAARYLSVMEERAHVMTELTDELLRYSMTKSAIQEIVREEVVLNHVLEESIAAYYGVITEQGILPKITMPERKVSRSLNKTALLRIFGNILSNAAKYSDGDLAICLTEDGTVRFSNHASALDELRVEQLFGRYFTVDNAQASTGIGLSIAKLLTEKMGGEIHAEYQEDVLTVSVSFPPPAADEADKECG